MCDLVMCRCRSCVGGHNCTFCIVDEELKIGPHNYALSQVRDYLPGSGCMTWT